jgi:type I restriction enzyme, S subunit
VSNEIVINELPSGWQRKSLSSIAGKPQYGWTTKARSDGSVKLLRTTDISSGSVNWATVPGCDEAPLNISKYLLRPGDIVVSRAGSVGFSYLVDESCPPNAIFASYLMRIRPDSALMRPELLRHYMRSPQYWRQVNEASVGVGLANVNGSKLSAMQVPVPPRDLQDKLTQILDSARARGGSVSRRLSAARRAIESFRQAVLSAACSGRLTADWREEHNGEAHQLAEELRSRSALRRKQLAEPQSDPLDDLPADWEIAALDLIIDHIEAGKSFSYGTAS